MQAVYGQLKFFTELHFIYNQDIFTVFFILRLYIIIQSSIRFQIFIAQIAKVNVYNISVLFF